MNKHSQIYQECVPEPILEENEILAVESVKCGNLDALKHAYSLAIISDEPETSEWFMQTWECAIQYGQFECLCWLYTGMSNKYRATYLYYMTELAAKYGHIVCFKYLTCRCPDSEKTYSCNIAATYGHLDCLTHAYHNGYHWNEYAYIGAARNGHMDCIRFLISKYRYDWNHAWDEKAVYSVAENGHYEILKLMYKAGMRPPKSADMVTLIDKAKYNHRIFNCILYTKPGYHDVMIEKLIMRKANERTKLFTQELVAKALHPKRIAQWMDEC